MIANGLDYRETFQVFSPGFDLDMARAYTQAGGSRDHAAIRHLDTADRIAPGRTRMDPLAREMVLSLRRRAKRSVWELDSLARRFGVA